MTVIGGRVVAYLVAGTLAIFAILSLAKWIGGRDALHDAELDRLTKRDAALVREIANERATLRRQLASVAGSRDTSRMLRARSDTARSLSDSMAKGMTVKGDSSIKGLPPVVPGERVVYLVPPAVKDRIDADSVTIATQGRTIAQQGRTIIRDSVALATAQRVIVLSADSLAQVRADIARNLRARIPSKWGRRVERVALVAGAGYVGWRVGLAARR